MIAIVCIAAIVATDEGAGPEKASARPAAAPTPFRVVPVPLESLPTAPMLFDISNWEVTIRDFRFEDYIDINAFRRYVPAENCQYAILDLTVKNLGKEMDTFLPIISFGDDVELHLICGEYVYTRSVVFLSDEDIFAELLNPLAQASGIVPFEVPQEIIESDVEIFLEITADGEKAAIPIRQK